MENNKQTHELLPPSSTEYYFKPVTPEDIDTLCKNMRLADRKEVHRMCGFDLKNAVKESVKASKIVYAGFFKDGALGGIFGASCYSILSTSAVLWGLTTNAVNSHRLAYVRATKAYIDFIFKSMPYIDEFENAVDTEYSQAHKWIEAFGGTFEIASPIPTPYGGAVKRFYIHNPYYSKERAQETLNERI